MSQKGPNLLLGEIFCDQYFLKRNYIDKNYIEYLLNQFFLNILNTPQKKKKITNNI